MKIPLPAVRDNLQWLQYLSVTYYIKPRPPKRKPCCLSITRVCFQLSILLQYCTACYTAGLCARSAACLRKRTRQLLQLSADSRGGVALQTVIGMGHGKRSSHLWKKVRQPPAGTQPSNRKDKATMWCFHCAPRLSRLSKRELHPLFFSAHRDCNTWRFFLKNQFYKIHCRYRKIKKRPYTWTI